ncbi:ExeM/NucH family extracellular endonuclease [Oxalobacteraceae bacterium]|nr:ExeM/NucH family extracellular endonuclease [Oxalobacteraceae bacterium]
MKNFASSGRTRAEATPGRMTVLAALLAGLCAPAVAADVVISQVYGGGGNSGATWKNDFIELFNRGASPVSLNGWSVQYNSAASAAGAKWQVTPLPNLTLEPGQYLLVKESKGAGGTVDLPAAQAEGTILMSGTSGKVALSSSTVALAASNPAGAEVLDLVGYGSSVNGFEGAPGPGLSNTLAAQRGDYGCTDTNNNASDFSTAAPEPRNTASDRRVCGTPVVLPIVATCPAALAVAQDSAGGAELTAVDADGIVNAASIVSATIPGISLVNFVAASAAGASASVSLSVGAGVPVGSYPVQIRFANDQSQEAVCSVAVNVQALAAVSHSIPQIQGTAATSPYANTVQTTEGVLTRKVSTGFFLQDPQGDGNPASSDAIFVYTGATSNGALPGDLVRVTGTVVEYTPTAATRSITEFKDVTAVVTQSSGHSITAQNIDLADTDLASLEGMLVRFAHPLTVAQGEFLGSRGELSLSSGRLEVPTNRYRPGPQAQALAAANARNLIVLDDGLTITPPQVPYIGADATVRAGDSVAGLTGVIDYGSIGGGGAAFKLQPTLAPVFSRDNPRAAPAIVAGNVKVASANVLNFFTTFTSGADVTGATGQGCSLGASISKSNCRGADNMNEFTRQLNKIVGELQTIDADVFGLMEIQNKGEYSVGYLVDALNQAIGGTVYAVVPKPADTGTDAIRVAMIYKPAKLSLVGGALSDGDAINNRPPMAQTFMAGNGEKFSVVVNHLKSKGSCPAGSGADSDRGDGQACWNATRVLQAQRLINSFVPQVVAAAGDPDVLLIGDFNAHGFEDPIDAITASGYVNQLERYVRPLGMPYSFIFDSESGYLDHALASASLSGQVAGAIEWHNNADEPTVIDYNTDGKPQDLYNALPYRASDHDPVIISLNLQPAYADVSASLLRANSGLAYNRATGRFTGTLSLSNTGATPLSGPFQVVFEGLTAGVSLANATGSHAGASYITVNAASLAPGATLTLPLNFINPAKASINYTARIYSGTF